MEVGNGLHMVGGSGVNSYAVNSFVQKKTMLESASMVTEAVRQMCCRHRLAERISVADLGCSSGPNALLLIRNVAVTTSRCYRQMSRRLPDVHFFLNDLPGNDFNTLFRSIEQLHEDLYDDEAGNGDESEVAPVYVCGVPGSFFGRILPKNSIHFVHSSYSLHYLSQLPQAFQTDAGARLNKRNIYLSKTSSRVVIESYTDQFQKDYFLFLKSRAEELKAGGHMVLIHLGRDNADSANGSCCSTSAALGETLSDMVSEGVLEEDSLETFNLPIYFPSLEEVTDLIDREGSFALRSEDVFKMDWGPFVGECEIDDVGRYVAKYMRAALEPMLASHFKDVNMDVVFEKYAKKIAKVPKEERFRVIVIVNLEKVRRYREDPLL